jgi:hypothetical protein
MLAPILSTALETMEKEVSNEVLASFCAVLADLGCENKANNHDRERLASPARL